MGRTIKLESYDIVQNHLCHSILVLLQLLTVLGITLEVKVFEGSYIYDELLAQNL